MNKRTRVLEKMESQGVDALGELVKHQRDVFASESFLKEGYQLFKGDHEGAFRWLPVKPAERDLLWVVVITPEGPVATRHNALSFGSAAAPRQYVRVSSMLCAVQRRVMGCPLMHYVDDFFTCVVKKFASSCFESFELLHELTGLKLAEGKTEPPCTSMELLGVQVQCHGPDDVSASPKRSRCLKLHKEMLGCKCQGAAPNGQKSKRLAGKLSFTATSLMGRWGRAYIRVFYRLGKLGWGNTRLKGDQQLQASIDFWVEKLPLMPDMKRQLLRGPRPKVTLETDAAVGRNGVGRVGFGALYDGVKEKSFLRNEISRADIGLPEGANVPIGVAETGCAVSYVYAIGAELAGTELTLKVDNKGTHGALCNGCASDGIYNGAAAAFWDFCARHDVDATVVWIPGKANNSDGPSRGKAVPGVPERKMLGDRNPAKMFKNLLAQRKPDAHIQPTGEGSGLEHREEFVVEEGDRVYQTRVFVVEK